MLEQQQLTSKIARLSEAVALEIHKIQTHLGIHALFAHINSTQDKPPSIRDVSYIRKAHTRYKKIISLDLLWRNEHLVKEIVLFTPNIYVQDNLFIPDKEYSVYIPYYTAIYGLSDNDKFEDLICRKTQILYEPWNS